MANSTAQTSAKKFVVLDSNVVVTRTRIIGTAVVFYEAWEPTKLMDFVDGHSTLRSVDGVAGHLGRVGTKRLPANIDALPAYSTERLLAVRGWHQREYERAYAAIWEAYPELGESIGFRADMGEIETREGAD